MKIVMLAAVLLATSQLAIAQTAPGAAEHDAYMQRTGELAELVWEFQVAGTDLCEARLAYLPGFATGIDANTIVATASAGADMQDVPQSIIRVFSGSPAAAAGLQAGDVIRKIDGEQAYGVTWRGHSRWDAAWTAAKAKNGPTTYTVERAGAQLDVTLTPQRACDIQMAYVQGATLAPRTPGLLVLTPVVDQVGTERWEQLAFLAPEVAVSMNPVGTARNRVSRASGFLSGALAHVAGMDLGQIAQLGTAKAFSKEQRLAGDRIGMFLLARLGVDVTQVPAYWARVYALPTDDSWSSTFFGTRPTLAERQQVLDRAIADIQAAKLAGLPLDPYAGE